MNKSEYDESGWLLVRSKSGDDTGITKVFKQDSLPHVLTFSKHAFQIIEQEDALDVAMIQMNGFESVIGIRARSAAGIGDHERRLAGLIDEVAA